MKKSASSFWIQTLQGIITVFFLALLGITVFRPDLAQRVIRAAGELSSHLGHWNFLIVMGTSFIESFPVLGVLVPGQQIMLVAGGFYGQSHFWLAAIAACIGAIFGNWVGYILGVRYGLVFLETYGDVFALGKTEQKILAKRIDQNGAAFIILGKFHNFTRAFVPFLSGAFSMKHGQFWTYNIVGSVIWSFSILALGVFFTTYINIVLDWISWFFLGLLILVIAYVATFKRKEFMEYVREKEKELQK